jgi:hypothetical protein
MIMSHNEGQSGTLNFTQAGYKHVMREMRNRFNHHINEIYDHTLLVHALLTAMTGAKISQRRKTMFIDMLKVERTGSSITVDKKSMPVDYSMQCFIEGEMFRGTSQGLTKPRRSAFPKLTNKQSTFKIDCGDGSLTFCEDRLSVSWYTEYDTNAVENARDSFMSREFIDFLKDYKWKRAEGGIFQYWDDGPMSISDYFGPSGEAHRQLEIKKWDKYIKQRKKQGR